MIFPYRVLLVTILFLPAFFTPSLTKASANSYSSFVPGLLWSTWGGSRNSTGNAVSTDSSGNIYVVGTTDGFGTGMTDALLLKYNPKGSILWVRTWGGTNADEGIGVAVEPRDQGGVYITGDTLSFGGTPSIFLVKFSLGGNLIWQDTWSGNVAEHVKDMAVDANDNVLLTGETASFGAGNYDICLLKFDSNGALLWQRSWGGGGIDLGAGVTSDSLGNIYLTGSSTSLGPTQSGILLKFNSTGDLLWQRAWNGSQGAVGSKVALDTQGNVYFAGNTSSFGAGALDVLLMKFNSTGGLLWQKTWGGNETDFAEGIALGSDGDIFVSGSSAGNAFMLKLNSTRIPSSFTIFGYRETSESLGMTVDPSGNAVATGYDGMTATWYPSLPLLFRSGNDTLGLARFNITSPMISAQTPNILVGHPSGTVSSPTGSQDKFYRNSGNGNDVLLLKSIARPANYTVTFNGYILFDGRYGGANRTQNITEGTHFAQMRLSEHATGFAFNATGGITIDNYTYSCCPSLTVIVTITGPGTLTGIEYCCDFDQYQYRPHPTFPSSILLVLTLISWPALIIRRRIRRQ